MEQYKEVDDFKVMALVDIYLYQNVHPDWDGLHKQLIEAGYSPSDVWKVLHNVREQY